MTFMHDFQDNIFLPVFSLCHFYSLILPHLSLGSSWVPLPHTDCAFHSRGTFSSTRRKTRQLWLPLLGRPLGVFTICVNKSPLWMNNGAPLGRSSSPEASRESCVPHPLTDRGAVLLQGDDGLGLVRPGGGRGSGVVFLEEIWFFHILLERWVGLCPMGSGDHVDL